MGKKKEIMAVANGGYVPDMEDAGGDIDNHVQTRKEIVAEDLILEGLVVELPDHVMERLAALSVEEYRTPELQAAYMIHRMMDRAEEMGGAA